MEARLNGDTEVTFNGSTYNGAGPNAMNHILLRAHGNQSRTRWDDIIITSVTGEAPNSWMGPTVIRTMLPVIPAGPNQATPTPALDATIPSVTAHQWWRINTTGTPETLAYVTEVAWYTAYDGQNVAVGGTTPNPECFDNNQGTRKTTKGPIPYQFTSPILPVKMSIMGAAKTSDSVSWSPTVFTIDYSDDGSSWTTWKTIRLSSWSSISQTRTILIGEDTNANRLSDGVLSVDNVIVNGTSPYNPNDTYLNFTTLHDQEMFEFGDIIDPALTIQAVVLNSVANSTGYSNRRIKHVVRSDYNIQESANLLVPPSSALTCQSVHTTDPETGAAWTTDGFNAAEFGVTLSL